MRFNEFTICPDATARPVGEVKVLPAIARPMIHGLRQFLLKHDDGQPFGFFIEFDHGQPAEGACQRIGNTACLAKWLRHGQLLALTVMLSGLDKDDDDNAVTTLREGIGLVMADEFWEGMLAQPRLVIVNIFLAPGSFGDDVVRGAVVCLGAAFGPLLGTGEGT